MRRPPFLAAALACLLATTGCAGVRRAGAHPSDPRPLPRSIASRTATGCFASPGRCGYPDPRRQTVGPAQACRALTPSASITTSAARQTIQDLDVTGTITVNRPRVTIRNVCVTANGGSASGSVALQVLNGADHTRIEDTTIRGAGAGPRNSVDMAVKNWSGKPATLSHDYLYNCGECIHDGPWQVADSYVISNGMQHTGEHYEAAYYDNDVPAPGMRFEHDVLLNPEDQSGVIFSDDTTPNRTCAVNLTVQDSLIAGGGGMISFCGKTDAVGRAIMRIVDDRFARCRTRPITVARDGGTDCSGNRGTGIAAGADSHGYWPRGGHYATNGMKYCRARQSVWIHNVWDDNARALRCS